jgi:crotonobetainyl-CoA:carnitine CoA-transferase CaiB-like acyl-CoA transferase
MGIPIADMTAALFAACGVVGALLDRERSGKGQMLSVNLLDAAMALQGTHITEYFTTGQEPVPCGNDSPFAYPVGVFEAADGYLAISAYNDKFWRALCKALDLMWLVNDSRFDTAEKRIRNKEELRPVLSSRFANRPRAAWMATLDQADVPCGPVHSYHTLFRDPQVVHNRLVRELPHAGLEAIRTVGNPLRFSRTPVSERFASPLLGDHTESVLAQLGYSASEIQSFRKQKII